MFGDRTPQGGNTGGDFYKNRESIVKRGGPKMFRLNRFSVLILCIGLVISGVSGVLGQEAGVVEGVVTDQSKDRPLIGANVQLIGTSLGAATDEHGYYRITGVPPGDYDLEVSFLGYKTAILSVSVASGQTARVDAGLVPIPLKLDEILVTTVRERADSPVSISMLTPEEIQASRHVGAYDAFKHLPGVHVVKAHAIGTGLASRTAGRVLIRGLGRRAGGDLRIRGIMILVDGIPDFSQMHGHPFPDVHALDNVESIEVVKGPASVRYGNALAGAIIMKTATPHRGLNTVIKASGGSFATTENMARFGYGGDQGFIQISGNFRHTDGHLEGKPDKLTAYNGSLKVGYNLSPRVKVTANAMLGSFNWENPGPAFTTGGETDWMMGHVTFDYTSGKNSASLKLWGVDGKVTFNNGTEEPQTDFGAKARVNIGYGNGSKITLGLDWMNYDVGRNETFQGQFNEVAPLAIVTHRFSSRVFVEAGLRYTYNEQFGNDLSPELGIVYRPSRETAFRARAAHGFRTPNAFETTFGPNANPDLDAADLWQYEIGFNQTILDRATVDVAAFLQEGDNMIRIISDPNAPSGRRFANTGRFTHRGIESALTIRLTSNLAVTATTTNLNLEDDTALTPHNIYTLGLAFTPGPFTFSFDGRQVTGLYNADNKQDPLDDFLVVDFQAMYQIRSGVHLILSVDNIFNESYELAKGFPMPERSFYAGFSVNR
ncbi:MAG: TonB-dependent receptor [Calditrichaeota bacterium]|nr:MAG: TonB-dependent receptor [Calditrichota bacterium]